MGSFLLLEVLRTANDPASLAGYLPDFPRAHECRQRVASWQAASGRIDPKWQADEVLVGEGEEEQGRKHIEQPCRRH
jgi:hypothetical protein